MRIPITPLKDQVLTKAKEKQTKTASGLYIPDSAAKDSSTAEVLAVGEDVKGIEVGDYVIYTKEYDTTEIEIETEKYKLIKAENIIAKVEGN